MVVEVIAAAVVAAAALVVLVLVVLSSSTVLVVTTHTYLPLSSLSPPPLQSSSKDLVGNFIPSLQVFEGSLIFVPLISDIHMHPV